MLACAKAFAACIDFNRFHLFVCLFFYLLEKTVFGLFVCFICLLIEIVTHQPSFPKIT